MVPVIFADEAGPPKGGQLPRSGIYDVKEAHRANQFGKVTIGFALNLEVRLRLDTRQRSR